MPAANDVRPLATLGPFIGADFTTEPAFLSEGMAAACSNVDPSTKTKAFTIAKGRTLVTASVIPAGYYVTGLCMFTEMSGPVSTNPAVQGVRLLIISATGPQGVAYTAIYNTATGNSVNCTGTLLPFTQATQFQDGVYTNAGQQIRIRAWGGPLSLDGMTFIISAWQVARPAAASALSLGSVAVTNGSGPGAGEYSYALAYLIGRTTAQNVPSLPFATIAITGAITSGDVLTVTLNGHAVAYTVYSGDTSLNVLAEHVANGLAADSTDAAICTFESAGNVVLITAKAAGSSGQYSLAVSTSSNATETLTIASNNLAGNVAPSYTDTTYQLTQPYYIPGNVIITDANHAPEVTIRLPMLTPFPRFNAGGDYTITPVMFRASLIQATYFQVPWNGVGSVFIDASTDSQIAGNLSIVSPSAGVPPPFSFFLEQGFAPSGLPSMPADWTYYDYGFQSATGFSVSHKGRLWAFALYPNTWDWTVYNSGMTGSGTLLDVLLQAQVWWSSVGVAWQFDAVNGVLPVGPEEVVGNINTSGAVLLPQINPMPWTVGLIEDTPMGMVSIGSELVLHKSNNMYMVWGDTGAEFSVWPIADIGTMSAKSITPFEGGDGWLAPQGVYFYNGGTPGYIGENVRGLIDSLSFATIQDCIGFYRERTFYLSFPDVVQTVQPVITPETLDGSNSGTASVKTGTVTVNASQETASASISCVAHGRWIGNEFVLTWVCVAGPSTPATWTVDAAAPVSSGTQLTFEPTAISGTAPGANLALLDPNGNTLASWSNIVALTTYSYFSAAAIAGTYTWTVTANLPSYSSGSTDESGTYTAIVTPTLTYEAGTGTAVNGPITTVAVTSAVAPTTSANELTLDLSSVVTPSDGNGSTAYNVVLTDSTGFQWLAQSGITSTTVLAFSNDNAPPGNYTWTVQALVTVGGGGSSSNYSVSCSLVAGWNEESGGQVQTQGFTLAYYTPTQQWYYLGFAVNAAVTTDYLDNLTYCFVDQSLYTWNSNTEKDAILGTLTATWTGAWQAGQAPGLIKEYRYIIVDAPVGQTGATFEVTLDVDQEGLVSSQTFTGNLDTGPNVNEQGTTAWVFSCAQGTRGYVAQLSLSVTGPPGTVIRNVYAVGTPVRDFAVNSQ